MVYHKTHEGRAALKERNALSLRERQLMVLFNGSRTMKELADLFGPSVTFDVERLERRGFIVGRPEGVPLESRFDSLVSLPDATPSDAPSTVPQRTSAPDLQPASSSRMSMEQFAQLADVPPLPSVPPELALPKGDGERAERGSGVDSQLAHAIYSISAEPLPSHTPVAAQVYVTQVLMVLDTSASKTLIESSCDVRADADILMYVAQAIGHTYAVAGEEVALRVAMRASRLLPSAELPTLVDCTLDYVPSGFSVLLYEFVLAGREAAA